MTSITLRFPVQHDGKTVSQLTLRQPTMNDLVLQDTQEGEIRKSMALYAGLTDTDLPLMGKLHPLDFAALAEASAPMLGNSDAGIGPAS